MQDSAARPHLEVADILRVHGDAYRRDHRVSDRQAKVWRHLVDCRTAALGGHVDRCTSCERTRISYNSCRDRHCPKCQSLKKAEWLEARREHLLPIPYWHLVFTLPEALRPLALSNKRVVYADSPFQGEGHRKIHARLRPRGVRVSRKRLLRVLREAGLLACQPTAGPVKVHDGTIVTEAPNRMWGTDGTRFLIGRGQDAEWAWLFITVDHFNFDPIGFEVSKIGDRFHAFTAVEAAVRERLGRVEPGVARGIALRSDQGSVYTSDYFMQRVKALGLYQSYAFVREPECNGVAERFIRLIKEQCLWVEEFTDLEDARRKIAAFIERYRHGWLLERHGYRTPAQVLKQALEQAA